MSASKPVMQVIGTHPISNQLLQSNSDKFGGLITDGQYAWFTNGADITLYSKHLGSVVSSRSFATNQKDKSIKITFVKELSNSEETCNFILIGCSFKSSGILFICQLPTLTTIRCIELPNAVSYISTIVNQPLDKDQLCDEFNVMSTVLLVGLATGAVYAIDLRQNYIEEQLRRNEIVVNESRPSKIFIVRKNENCQEVKEMSDDSDSHLAMFINEHFYAYCKKYYTGKLNLKVSSLLYIEEINTIAIGYATGHYQLWDCKIMRTICLLKEPKCAMPVTHISFMEPSDDPNNLCYLWIIQSDNSKLPNATMIALTYQERIVMPNGRLSYRVFKGDGVKLEMSLKRETGIGRCISALSLSNVNLFRNETDMDEDCEIKLFAMLIEKRENIDADPESYIFLFDINQWYKAQMPSNINHFQISNSYASFVKLPYNNSCLDFIISDKTLRPFGYNFRNNVEELYYPSSIYFECDCLMNSEIIELKHAGIQQDILDQLLLKSWRLLTNPTLVFNQCLQTKLRPFFWDKPEDYVNYSLLDQRSFVVSILIENKILSVLSACAEEWKNGTYASTGATILHLVQSIWKHVMVVKQFADKLCVPLFDYSGTRLDKKNKRILNHCLSQMECVKHFLKELHNVYGVHIINVDYSYRVYTLNLVTQYFKAVTIFLNYGLLPESIGEDPTQRMIQCDFNPLIKYANKRRLEFGDSQLYLIDAMVYNEPKGNKLIEQWQHEGGEATKGMYPPSTVQCLLRIYLNSALSDQLKDFITIYFLIDVCSSQDLNVAVANRMCNFAVEFDVENKGLNTLCRATWLFDHDMFEDAITILSSNKEWMMDSDKSWVWFHWTVLKLLVFKTEYYWARFYMKLLNIKPENVDDHKFYINLQVMNDQYFDALNYIRSKPPKEKLILFEYFFDRCRETNKLKCLIEYLLESEEEELFYSYLKKLNDPESLTFQLLFLLQRGRYIEAIELNKSLKGKNKSKYNDDLEITSLLVSGFEKSIPITMRQSYSPLPVKSLYKKTVVVTKCMNSDIKMFNVMDRKTENIDKVMNSPIMSSNLINLIIPPNNTTTRKRSPTYDLLYNEKRRKITEDLILSPPKVVKDEMERPIEKHVLEILKTPLVEKTLKSPSVTNCSSILKTGSAKHHKRIMSIKSNEIPASKTILRFSLPDDDKTSIEQVVSEEIVDTSKASGNKNDELLNIESCDANSLPNPIIKESFDSAHIVDEKDNECEQMDISEDCSFTEFKTEGIIPKENSTLDVCLDSDEKEICTLTSSDDEEDQKTSVTKSIAINTNSTTYQNNEKDLQVHNEEVSNSDSNRPIVNIEAHEIVNRTIPNMNAIPSLFIRRIHNVNSNCSNPVGEQNNYNVVNDLEDDDLVILDSEDDEIEKKLSSSSCSDGSTNTIKTLDSINSDSCDSDLENTRYGRFKSHNEEKIEVSDEDVLDDSELEEGEEEEECEEEEEEEEEGEEEEDSDGLVNDEDSCCIVSSEAENDQSEEVNLQQYDIPSVGVNDGNLQLCRQVINIDTDRQLLDKEYNIYQPSVQFNHENDGFNSEHHLESYDDPIMYMHPNEYEENNFGNHNINFDNVNEKNSMENDNIQFDKVVEETSLKNDNVEFDKNEETSLESDNVEYDEEVGLENDDGEIEETGFETNNVEFDGEDEESDLESDNVEYDEEVEEIGSENDGRENDFENNAEEYEYNSSEKYNLKDKDNTLKQYNYVELNDEVGNSGSDVFQKEGSKDNTLITYSECLNSNVLQNLSSTFDLTKETPNNNIAVCDVTNENAGNEIAETEIVFKSSMNDQKNINQIVGHINTNICDIPNELNKVKEDNNEETIDVQNDVFNATVEECPSAIRDPNIEETITKFNPIPENCLNHISMTKTQSSQLGSFGVDVNQSTSFLFGKPFFGQQDTSDHKPILLFGQLYSSDKEQSVVDSHNDDEPKAQNLNIDNHKIIVTNRESEDVELVDEIQDILELESLPESNPDGNLDAHECSRSNSLQPDFNERNETININDQSPVPSNDNSILQNIVIQESETEKQISTINSNLSMTHKPLDNTELTVNQNNQIPPMLSEEKIIKTDNVTINNVENDKIPCNVLEQEKTNKQSLVDSQSIQDMKTTSILRRSIRRATSEQKESNITVMTRSKRAKSLIPNSITDNLHINENNQLLQFNNTIDFTSSQQSITTPIKCSKSRKSMKNKSKELPSEIIPTEDFVQNNFQSENDNNQTNKSIITPKESLITKKNPRRSIRAKSEQPLEKMPIELINSSITHSDTIVDTDKKVGYEIEQQKPLKQTTANKSMNPYVSLVQLPDINITTEKMVECEVVEQPLLDKTDRLEDYGDLNSSRRTSLRSVTKTRRYSAILSEDSENKTKESGSNKVEENQHYVQLSNVNEKKNNETNNTKKRGRSAKSNELAETDIIKRRTRAKSETNLNQMETDSLNIFRTSEMLKDDTRQMRVSLSRKTAKTQGNIISTKQESGCSKSSVSIKPPFTLELIPEEESSNPAKNEESEQALTRKSKFNFLMNKSKPTEHNTNLQYKSKAKTPSRRSKSMEPSPARTLSTIKSKKPKRSSSANLLLLSDEENEENDRIETYKKAIQTKQKRSISVSVKSRKTTKISSQDESIHINAESETESNVSNQIVNVMFTPSKKRTKIPIEVLSSENYDSSDEDSVVSKRRMMTTSMTLRNSSITELEPNINRRNEKSSADAVTTSPPAVKENKKSRNQRKVTTSSTFEIQNSPKRTVTSDTGKSDVNELPKRRKRNTKEILQAPIDLLNDTISERRITRSQHLLLDKSLQSKSTIIEQDETPDTPIKSKQKKSNN